jgi:hypothetical protein
LKITALTVADAGKPAGVVRFHNLLRAEARTEQNPR